VPLFRNSGGPAASPATGQPGAAPEPPPIVAMLGDPLAFRIKADLDRGRWQEFHDFLEATRDWTVRDFYVTVLSNNVDGRPEWLEEWVAARPRSAVALLFRGAHGVKWAWDARGGGLAKAVQEEAWPLFHARLVDADRDLARAAALDDTDPTPHAESITVAMGLSLGLTEARRRFGEAARRDPWHNSAHTRMVQITAAKWAGSHEEMLGFARWASARAPEGLGLHQVIPLAHVERWFAMSREPTDGKVRARTYFRNEEVRAEIRQAALRSIYSPRYVPTRNTVSERNVFAMTLRLTHDYAAQLDQMHLIGPLNQKYPWQYHGKPGVAYEQARQSALKGVSQPGGSEWRPNPAP
jgi:hypothetical protein